jgi:hypothetical protein
MHCEKTVGGWCKIEITVKTMIAAAFDWKGTIELWVYYG